ncbi:DNA gyrase subunit A chloroplastic/mitochondrial-like, partial [Trifolium medium]|nr:DNA gyrase subunit A chloroplastic/mitochondrial-like [Trifolium medium]
AYRTGRGRVIVRGKTDVELLDSKSKRSAIIIKEIPYQTNKSALVEKIADLVESKLDKLISSLFYMAGTTPSVALDILNFVVIGVFPPD